MPANLTCQAVIKAASNLPEDHVVNTWHFQTTTSPPPASDLNDIRDALIAFYGNVGGGWPQTLVTGAVTLKWYNDADAPPRRTIREDDFTVSPISSNPALPPELAIVLSYNAQFVSGTPSARKRGRLYLGPFHTPALAAGGVVLTSFVNQIATAAATLLTTSDSAGGWAWVQKSTGKYVDGVVGPSYSPVIAGWVDNAWDVQRRRGRDASVRDAWP